MSLKHLVLLVAVAPAILVAAGCAKGADLDDGLGGAGGAGSGSDSGSSVSGSGSGTASSMSKSSSQSGTGSMMCGDMCDQDNDGVVDGMDTCPGTPPGEPVNGVGCSEGQVQPKLQPSWPPYGLEWTPTGDPGRPGGLTWTYTGIDKGELFHIYWVICDDPATPCGLSLDGPIDLTGEHWSFNAVDSDLPNGKVVFSNLTNIALADGSTPPVAGRLTVTGVGADSMPMPFGDLNSLGIVGREGEYATEIKGVGFTITMLIEVQDAAAVWTPYLDYYDAAATPEMGMGLAQVSIGGSFYDE